MIQEFVDRFMANKSQLESAFSVTHPDNYDDLVKAVVTVLATNDHYDSMDPERITRIDHGDYQGTLLYIIGAQGYQPSTYWSVKVSYGSCSGCDTLQAIQGYDGSTPTSDEIEQYMTLALHIVQGLKEI